MKKFILLFSVAFIMTLVLDSCSVQKRYHRKGFTVNWNNASVKMKKNRKVLNSENTEETIVSNSEKKEKLANNYHANRTNDMAAIAAGNTPIAVGGLNISEETMSSREKTTNTTFSSKELANQNIKSTRKAAKKIIKVIKKEQRNNDSNTDTVLLVILALVLPFIGAPLAVYLYEGYWTERCTINVILSLLCGLPGLIHALVVILGNR
jgi:uncharacterized membrane protein YqaE (UPF0057 family)